MHIIYAVAAKVIICTEGKWNITPLQFAGIISHWLPPRVLNEHVVARGINNRISLKGEAAIERKPTRKAQNFSLNGIVIHLSVNTRAWEDSREFGEGKGSRLAVRFDRAVGHTRQATRHSRKH